MLQCNKTQRCLSNGTLEAHSLQCIVAVVGARGCIASRSGPGEGLADGSGRGRNLEQPQLRDSNTAYKRCRRQHR